MSALPVFTTLTVTVSQGIATAVIDVPKRRMNVFTPELIADLNILADTLLSEPAWRGLVFVSGKESGFIAGADLHDIAAWQASGLTAPAAAQWAGQVAGVFRRFETAGKPVAAAISGAALGGGFELALACHWRVASDAPSTVVGLPEVTVGLLPGAGGTQRLPRLIGIERALPLLLQGRVVGAGEALALGLINAVVPAGSEAASAHAWVSAAAAAGSDVTPAWDRRGFKMPHGDAAGAFGIQAAALRAQTQDRTPAPLTILQAVYEGSRLPFERAMHVEARLFGTLAAGAVSRGLIRTSFVNRRNAARSARAALGLASEAVVRLGVIGAGMMGAGIASQAATAGLDVVLVDTSLERAKTGALYPQRAHRRAVASGAMSQDALQAILTRITPADDLGAVAGCDIVIEAVFEDMALKHELLARMESIVGPHTVLASNTSTLRIGQLAAVLHEPSRLVGCHFFSPVERMPLVELIRGPQTSDRAVSRVLDLAARLGKTPVVVSDGPGFFTSRVFCSFIDEGMAMLEEGVAPALIENAARQAGMALGPLAVTDEVSLDLQRRVVDQAIADGVPEPLQRRHAQAVIARMNSLGRLGRKSGGGFQDFSADGTRRLWPGLAEEFPLAASQPAVETVQQRLLYAQALESARCLEEGIVSKASDADVAAVLGIGFPAWTGGPLSFIDDIGFPEFVRGCQQLADSGAERFRPSAWLVQRAGAGQALYPPVGQHLPEAETVAA